MKTCIKIKQPLEELLGGAYGTLTYDFTKYHNIVTIY